MLHRSFKLDFLRSLHFIVIFLKVVVINAFLSSANQTIVWYVPCWQKTRTTAKIPSFDSWEISSGTAGAPVESHTANSAVAFSNLFSSLLAHPHLFSLLCKQQCHSKTMLWNKASNALSSNAVSMKLAKGSSIMTLTLQLY